MTLAATAAAANLALAANKQRDATVCSAIAQC
jgi:hypothetical protein